MSNLPSGEIPRGAIRFNTDSNRVEVWNGSVWGEMQLSTPNLGRSVDRQPGVRGIAGGGLIGPASKQDSIDYWNMSSLGDAIDFGDLVGGARNQGGATSSSTRGLLAGGYAFPSPNEDTIEFVTIASTGNSVDFGNLTYGKGIGGAGVSNGTRGIFGGSYITSSPKKDATMDYVTIASTGNAVTFGEDTVATDSAYAANSKILGFYMGGDDGSYLSSIRALTMASLGDAYEFGDLPAARTRGGSASNAVRAIYGGGRDPSAQTDDIYYFTMATRGNAQTFGDLSTQVSQVQACASATRVTWFGGYQGTPSAQVDEIQYVEIATQGNSVDFGDPVAARRGAMVLSNGHGGL